MRKTYLSLFILCLFCSSSHALTASDWQTCESKAIDYKLELEGYQDQRYG